MPSTPPVIAVIHATPATMAPVSEAFGEVYPDADVWNLLDDRLVKDATRAGGLTIDLHHRMETLINYAVTAGADAVQLACSMYGPVAVASRHSLPVLASDQAMFDEVARLRPARVLILSSLNPAAEDSVERLSASLAEVGQNPVINAVVVEGAAAASGAGDLDELADLLTQAAAKDGDVDVIVLAQYSLAPVAATIAQGVAAPVLSGPHLAAVTLARALGEG